MVRWYTYWVKCMDLNLGLPRTCNHIFIVVDENSVILGMDFMQTFGMFIDLFERPSSSHWDMRCGQAWNPIMPLHDTCKSGRCFPQTFPSIPRPSVHKDVLPHSITYYIQTNGPPIHCKAKRLASEKLTPAGIPTDDETRQYLADYLSEYSSPHRLANKSPNTWRACGGWTLLRNLIGIQYHIYRT